MSLEIKSAADIVWEWIEDESKPFPYEQMIEVLKQNGERVTLRAALTKIQEVALTHGASPLAMGKERAINEIVKLADGALKPR